MTDSLDPFLNVTLNERYVIQALLAQSGTSKVYIAVDLRLKNEVVIKLYLACSPEALDQFENEVQLVASLLGHPNIIAVLDQGRWEWAAQPYPWIAFEKLGANLSTGLESASIAERISLLVDCCRGLEHAHSQRVFHRDIKPKNLLRAPGGTAKLGDFGLSIELHEQAMSDEFVPWDPTFLGTLGYMPPELHVKCLALLHARDALSWSERVGAQPTPVKLDLFSLGASMVEVLTGAPYLQPEHARKDRPSSLSRAYLKRIAEAPPLELKGYSRHLTKVVADCLQLNPLMRPNSVADVLGALEAQLYNVTAKHGRGLSSTPGTSNVLAKAYKAFPAIESVRLAIRRRVQRSVQNLVRQCNVAPWPWVESASFRAGGRREEQDWYVNVLIRPIAPRAQKDAPAQPMNILVPIFFAHYVGQSFEDWADWTHDDSDLDSSFKIGNCCSGLPIEAYQYANGSPDAHLSVPESLAAEFRKVWRVPDIELRLPGAPRGYGGGMASW